MYEYVHFAPLWGKTFVLFRLHVFNTDIGMMLVLIKDVQAMPASPALFKHIELRRCQSY